MWKQEHHMQVPNTQLQMLFILNILTLVTFEFKKLGVSLKIIRILTKQEDHDGPISLN